MEYVSLLVDFYGECIYSYTCHSVLHIPLDLDNWSGPKATWTAVSEGANFRYTLLIFTQH